MLKLGKIFYGWWIVLVSAVLNFLIGGTFYYGFTIFFNPIRGSFGWTAAATSVAFIFQRLELGLLAPVAGLLVDRVGPRKMMLCGWTVIGIGFFLMSRITSLWSFYGSFILLSMGVSFGTFVVMNTAVANWFYRKRSRALTLVYVGYGASGMLVPLIGWLVRQFQWRTTLVIVSIGLWVISIPLCTVIRHRPQPYGQRPDGEAGEASGSEARRPSSNGVRGQDPPPAVIQFTPRAAARTRAFWLLAFTFFFQQLATSAVMVHIVPFLESAKVPTAAAAFTVTGMTLCSLMGRFGFGFLGDFVDKRYLVATALALQSIGVFTFSFVTADRMWLIAPFLLLYAPGYGGPIPLRPAMQADYFGTDSFGTIMGLMTVITMIGGLVSPVFVGWMFDTMGTYTFAWRLIGFLVIPAIPLILLARPPVSASVSPSCPRSQREIQ